MTRYEFTHCLSLSEQWTVNTHRPRRRQVGSSLRTHILKHSTTRFDSVHSAMFQLLRRQISKVNLVYTADKVRRKSIEFTVNGRSLFDAMVPTQHSHEHKLADWDFASWFHDNVYYFAFWVRCGSVATSIFLHLAHQVSCAQKIASFGPVSFYSIPKWMEAQCIKW